MTTTEDHPQVDATPRTAGAWVWLLVGSVAVVAVYDVVLMAMIGEVIPPFAVGAALTVVGLALLWRRRRAGAALLGVVSLALLAAGLPFAVDHLPHPGSPIDFTHAVLALLGRVTAVIAAVGTWRAASPAMGRRVATAAIGLVALTVVVAGVATVSVSSDAPAEGDVRAELVGAVFPEVLTVSSGDVIHLDNRDRFRHTYTVPGTSLDVELPAATAVRFGVELPPGTYEVICDIPGHEFMTAQLIVE